MRISYQTKGTLIKNKMNLDNKKGLLEQQQKKKNKNKKVRTLLLSNDKETTYSKKSAMVRLLMIISLTSPVLLVQYQEQHAYAQSSDLQSPSQTTPSEEDPFASARERDRQAEAQYLELVRPSAASIQIIEEVRSECESSNFKFIGSQCVTLVYESPNTVVLDAGLLLISTDFSGPLSGNWDNPFIWKAVDRFKALGYLVTSVELGGQGNQGNPHNWHIVMSK